MKLISKLLDAIIGPKNRKRVGHYDGSFRSPAEILRRRANTYDDNAEFLDRQAADDRMSANARAGEAASLRKSAAELRLAADQLDKTNKEAA